MTSNDEDDDNIGLSGRRESRVSLLSVESYPNVSCALNSQDGLAGKLFFQRLISLALCIRTMTTESIYGMVERKHNLKMFRRSSLKSHSPYDEGEQAAYPERDSLSKSKVDRLSHTLPSITAPF
jgi:hypothetical protein